MIFAEAIRTAGTATASRPVNGGPNLDHYPLLAYGITDGLAAVRTEDTGVPIDTIARLFSAVPWLKRAEAVAYVASVAQTTIAHVEQSLEYLQSSTL